MRRNVGRFNEMNRAPGECSPLAQDLHVAEHDKARFKCMIGQRQTQIRADTRWLTCGDRQQRQRVHSSGRSST